MAHGFLQSFDNKLDVFSAGTKPAEKVNPMAVKVMDEMGIDLAHHTPKYIYLTFLCRISDAFPFAFRNTYCPRGMVRTGMTGRSF